MKKYLWIVAVLMCLLCVGCAKEKGEWIEEPVESADEIEEKLGIKMEMAEDVEGASDFQYCIINDEIGQVRFIYNGDEIFFRASKTKTLEEMGIMVKKNDDGYAEEGDFTTIDGDIEEGTYTSLSRLGLEDGGTVIAWSWGTQFAIVVPWSTYPNNSNYIALKRIAYNSYQ